jgi:hypothetical protein
MPVAVACPACGAKMTAPDRFAGKKVKCPKCGDPVVVPDPAADAGFEVVEDGVPPKPKPKSRPQVVVDEDDDRPRKRKPARDDDDYDDEEDDDDRPRRKTKAGKKSMLPLLIGGGGAAVLLLGLAAVVGYYLLGKDADATPNAGGGGGGGGVVDRLAGGPNWVKFDAPDGSFSVKFPNGPPTEADPMVLMEEELKNLPDTPQNQELKKMMTQMKDLAKGMMQQLGVKVYIRDDGGRKYYITTTGLGGMGVVPSLDQVAQMTTAQQKQMGAKAGGAEAVTVAGRTARQITLDKANGKRDIQRVLIAGDKMFALVVSGEPDMSPDDASVKTFFESFESNLKEEPKKPAPKGSSPKGPPGRKK